MAGDRWWKVKDLCWEPQEIWSLRVWGRKISRTVTLPVITLQSSSLPANVLALETSSESAARYPG